MTANGFYASMYNSQFDGNRDVLEKQLTLDLQG
jgi:hypothetical protein